MTRNGGIARQDGGRGLQIVLLLALVAAVTVRAERRSTAGGPLDADNGPARPDQAPPSSPEPPPGPPDPVDDAPAVSVVAFGARGDGVADDTAAFQRAAATGQPLVVPRPPAFYRVTARIDLASSVRGEGMPEIRMDGSDGSDAKTLLRVAGYLGSGIVISGLHLNGGWDGAASAQEHAHGIAIVGSRNVFVQDDVIEATYGDSVYVGALAHANSAAVVVRRNTLVGPRRCNVALVAVRGALVLRNVIRKSNAYVAAVDVEPNPDDLTVVEDVEIAGNDADAPATSFVNLFSFPPRKGYTRTVRNVTVARNTIRARAGVEKAPDTASFDGILVQGNEFFPADRTSVFVQIRHASGNGAATTNVVVEGNADHATAASAVP
ncbi:glycoside hydrolase family 55 protein [Anaeromyxobacter oryzae]|uniref:Rhamnogalacturonase A/B/Epimerase-like pectate lyase domain-containing protein n=1 Tax=Anaeromyxobacter oryzae TaxID=2918170 RepID=A0ABN6MQW8_9BACT|nr:glycoside hydrolase family 55 protein [Anaeromyxobacter oryzae]BDG02302.1 hypothetical protein AMOR_12980 [Anaeromyxobacter oryzae]